MPDGEKPDVKGANPEETADVTVQRKDGPEADEAGRSVPEIPVVGNVVPFQPRTQRDGFGDDGDPEDDWFAEEDDDMAEDGDGDSPTPRFPAWVRRLIIGILVIALVGQVGAMLPRIYNVDVIQFLKTARSLSQNEQVQSYKQAIVVVEAAGRKGTGFNVDERGRILTNNHVVEGAETALVGFEDGRVLRAAVVASDADADLALLEPVDPAGETFPALALDRSSSWQPGDPVYYIGNPLFFRHIAGQGTVLGLADAGRQVPVLLIEAPIHPGNSGSPVISEDGGVIGIIYASVELTADGREIKAGLAVPADHPFFDVLQNGRNGTSR